MSVMQRQYDYVFKVILIGSTSVGKTALLKRFADNEFNQTYLSTIGIDFRFKSFYLQDKLIKLQIWDTAGQQRFKNITKSYYNGSHAIVIVYDVNDEKSFEDLKSKWLRDALQYCDSKQIFILGNKADNKAQDFIKRQHYQWAKETGVSIVGVSAKTGHNLHNFFQDMTKKLMGVYPQIKHNVMRLQLEEEAIKAEQKCQC